MSKKRETDELQQLDGNQYSASAKVKLRLYVTIHYEVQYCMYAAISLCIT